MDVAIDFRRTGSDKALCNNAKLQPIETAPDPPAIDTSCIDTPTDDDAYITPNNGTNTDETKLEVRY